MDLQFGNYVVVDTLGTGGMGAVYRARHTELGVERAVKVMARPENADGLVRFERESRTLAGVSHPNVVKVHDAGVARGQPYFVMDLVEGRPLSDRLQSGGLPWREALKIAIGICRGVGALHAAGIVHRDLKPANVVLAADGRPVVVDLGLALAPARDERLTKTGGILGTLTYMAPEQFGSSAPDPRADVYALGLIAFELLTGEHAVEDTGEGIHGLTAAIINTERRAPSKVVPDLPARVDAVCLRAMSRQPEARHADANALSDAFADILEGPGVSARQTRSRRWGLAALAAVALVAGLGVLQGPPPPVSELTPPPADPAPTDLASANSSTPTKLLTLTASQVAEGTAELRELRREEDPRKRLVRSEEWLSRYAGHPRCKKAGLVRDQARLEFPIFVNQEALHVRDAAFTRAGLVVSHGEPALRLWDVDGGELLHTWLLGFSPAALAVAPDGVTVAAAGSGGRFVLIDVNDRSGPTKASSIPGLRVKDLAFDPEGKRLAVGGKHPQALVLSVPGLEILRRVGDHGTAINAITFASAGKRLVTGCGKTVKSAGPEDHAVRIFDPNGQQVGLVPYAVMVESIDAHGDLVVAGNSGGQLVMIRGDCQKVTHLAGHEVRAKLLIVSTVLAHEGSIRGLALSPDGARLYTVGNDMSSGAGEFRTWDVRSGEQLLATRFRAVPPVKRPRAFAGIALTPDGRRAALWTDRELQVWELPADD